MTKIQFSKFHGFGNDYVVIETNQISSEINLADFTKRFCHRHLGVGSDGIAFIEKVEDSAADFSCRIINPDGSEAGFSGNGTRCAVAYIYYKGLWDAENLRLRMKTGNKNYQLIKEISRGHYWFLAEIGKPKFASNEIPFKTDEKFDSVIDKSVIVEGEEFSVSCVNVGNPVACIFVDNFDFDWRKIGRIMETHEKFPDRANIVFVKNLDRENIQLKIWERAAGETAASGTCSSGAAILSAFRGETGRKVSVHTEGGITEVTWREDGEMLILGRADFVFSGEWIED